MRKKPSQLDRIERQVAKTAAHVYGGLDPDDGKPVVSHRERLAAIEESLTTDKEEKRGAKMRATIKEGIRVAAAAIAGVLGGHAGK